MVQGRCAGLEILQHILWPGFRGQFSQFQGVLRTSGYNVNKICGETTAPQMPNLRQILHFFDPHVKITESSSMGEMFESKWRWALQFRWMFYIPDILLRFETRARQKRLRSKIRLNFALLTSSVTFRGVGEMAEWILRAEPRVKLVTGRRSAITVCSGCQERTYAGRSQQALCDFVTFDLWPENWSASYGEISKHQANAN